ncbi:hypothetical protein WJX84_005051 [Apatococcus fuscideae]|uniref:Uncharacterized protein n=1 Tax=Apatococcus fuscideae TaxID=2026836 RepID=A0AAW1S7Z4_9CHLO
MAKAKRFVPQQEFERLKASQPSTAITLTEWQRATELVVSRAFAISVNSGPSVSEVTALLTMGISLAMWLWRSHPIAGKWLLAGTLSTAVASRAVVVAFALYDVKTIALLPIIDDLNHALVANVESRLTIKSSWQMLWEYGRWEQALELKAGAAGIPAGHQRRWDSRTGQDLSRYRFIGRASGRQTWRRCSGFCHLLIITALHRESLQKFTWFRCCEIS